LKGAFIPVNDSATCQVVRRKLNPDAVAQQDADVVLAHFARKIGQHLVATVKPYTELSAWQRFNDSTLYIYLVLFLFAHLAYLFALAATVKEHSVH